MTLKKITVDYYINNSMIKRQVFTFNCIKNFRLSTPEAIAVLLNVFFLIICFNF